MKVNSTLAGADVINASALSACKTLLTLNGGDGNDLLVGSQGMTPSSAAPAATPPSVARATTRSFGTLDLLDSGPGNNILIQD